MGERKEIKITTVEAKRQMDIIAQLSQHIKDKNLKFCISTFGCQMNAHDSEKIQGMLKQIGLVFSLLLVYFEGILKQIKKLKQI